MKSSKKKNIWLIKVPEPTPLDGENVRLFRGGILAAKLAEAGHNVTWWNTTVNHNKKIQRFTNTATVKANDRFSIIFLHALLYKKNTSLLRIINLYNTTKAFRTHVQKIPSPDIIIACLPPLGLCKEAVDYAKQHAIPIIIDVQDLWPDAFIKFAPSWFHPAMKLLLTPWFNTVKNICANATAITGTTDEFVNWALAYAHREKTSYDQSFPLAYVETAHSKIAIDAAEKQWQRYGVEKKPEEFIACFFGYLGRHYELEVIVEAARKLQNNKRSFKFVLCGASDSLEQYRKMAHDCSNVIFTGWVDSVAIWTLLQKSSVGLAPYRKTPTMDKNITNKPIEYWSAGLPVISSLEGILQQELCAHKCGITYAHGDVDGLVNILIELFDNREHLHAMSQNAYRLFKEKYSAEKVYNDMVAHIEKISDCHKGTV